MKFPDKLYLEQQDAVETFYEFHPEVFADLSKEEIALLGEYYFVNRPIIVDDIAEYAARMRAADPTLQSRAEIVLRKVFERLALSGQSMRELLTNDLV